MSKPTSVVLLCEDNLTSAFVRAYLRHCGVLYGVRVNVTQSGSGYDWVLRQFPIEVNAYRLAKARKSSWLIAVIDADTGTVARRLSQLQASLGQSEEPRVRSINLRNEMIACLVPRRNIETWILVLSGTSANEEDDYKNTKSRDEWAEMQSSASGQLYAWARPNARLPANCIDSILLAIRELARLETSN